MILAFQVFERVVKREEEREREGSAEQVFLN